MPPLQRGCGATYSPRLRDALVLSRARPPPPVAALRSKGRPIAPAAACLRIPTDEVIARYVVAAFCLRGMTPLFTVGACSVTVSHRARPHETQAEAALRRRGRGIRRLAPCS